jgi:hypothetical protein
VSPKVFKQSIKSIIKNLQKNSFTNILENVFKMYNNIPLTKTQQCIEIYNLDKKKLDLSNIPQELHQFVQ